MQLTVSLWVHITMANNFAAAISGVVKELKGVRDNLTLSYQNTLYDIGSTLVYYTPIKTGLASSNWNVTPKGKAGDIRQPVRGEKGLASLTAISYQVQGIDAGEQATFYNPVEYIGDLEGGSSRQAPAGMVTPTISNVEDIWIKNLKKQKLI